MMNASEKLRCNQIQIHLLDELKKICDKHNLVYWINLGTLLGAVRHKGFIPWDDDIDVSMPMEDYKKFLEISEKELPKDIFLQTPKTDKGYHQYFAKLRDCYSTFLEHHETGKEPYHHGIFIDIFPVVFYPKMPTLFRKVLTYATMKTYSNAFVLRKNVVINYLLYKICKFIWLIFSPFKSNKFSLTPEDSGFRLIPASYLYPLKDIEFEGKFYPGPQNPHEYLTILYKDYMTPLPPEQRIPHTKLVLLDTPCDHPRALVRKYE